MEDENYLLHCEQKEKRICMKASEEVHRYVIRQVAEGFTLTFL
jgi:hypothetical protein